MASVDPPEIAEPVDPDAPVTKPDYALAVDFAEVIAVDFDVAKGERVPDVGKAYPILVGDPDVIAKIVDGKEPFAPVVVGYSWGADDDALVGIFFRVSS